MKWNFQWWPRKNNVEFPAVFVFGLGISKGSNTILWNIQWNIQWLMTFILSGISRGKVNKKFQQVGGGWGGGRFSKKYILNPIMPTQPHQASVTRLKSSTACQNSYLFTTCHSALPNISIMSTLVNAVLFASQIEI